MSENLIVLVDQVFRCQSIVPYAQKTASVVKEVGWKIKSLQSVKLLGETGKRAMKEILLDEQFLFIPILGCVLQNVKSIPSFCWVALYSEEQYFWLLVLSRGLVGIGEASYSTIAPTIIGDLFTKNTRTLMLSVFYFAIPLGSGLGYITGSSVKQVAGDWRWALRVSPVLGMMTGTLILIFVPAAKRGNVEQLGGQLKARTSWLRDMKALIRNRSYVFSSLATSAVSFATGALGMWIPLYLHRAQVVQKTAETCSSQLCGTKDSLIFGAITCFTGFLGVITGAGATKWCRLKTQRADPLVCAVGMLGSAIFICLIFVAAKSSIVGAYICIFIGETLLFSNWAITADILM
ncbi:PREDICTED: protein spinster homolog 2-like, partial [Mesitornis unicolor]|uniref:protein spinster homolog 2-like n=1 Tax=Mesitornis unicolor TaxID=54374 RepID=UPI000528E3ED